MNLSSEDELLLKSITSIPCSLVLSSTDLAKEKSIKSHRIARKNGATMTTKEIYGSNPRTIAHSRKYHFEAFVSSYFSSGPLVFYYYSRSKNSITVLFQYWHYAYPQVQADFFGCAIGRIHSSWSLGPSVLVLCNV